MEAAAAPVEVYVAGVGGEGGRSSEKRSRVYSSLSLYKPNNVIISKEDKGREESQQNLAETQRDRGVGDTVSVLGAGARTLLGLIFAVLCVRACHPPRPLSSGLFLISSVVCLFAHALPSVVFACFACQCINPRRTKAPPFPSIAPTRRRERGGGPPNVVLTHSPQTPRN